MSILMNIFRHIDKDLLIDALEVAAKQRARNATKFKKGSAAHDELQVESNLIQEVANRLKTIAGTLEQAFQATPIETAIDKKSK